VVFVRKKNYSDFNKVKKDLDLYDINELIEMGLNKEEIAKELGVSKKYVKKLMEDYDDRC
jgi:orotate phosphoribosyltransferase-like protein